MTDADDMQTSPLSWPGERREAPSFAPEDPAIHVLLGV